MKQMSLTLLFICAIFFTSPAQSYNIPVREGSNSHPLQLGVFPTILNYSSDNHLHMIVQGEYELSSRQQLLFTGGFLTNGRFEAAFQQLVAAHPFHVSLAGGMGSFYGTYLKGDINFGITLGDVAYLNNGLRLNLYLDTSEDSPFSSDSPLWYTVNISFKTGEKVRFYSEAGIPLVDGTTTWFGMGIKFNL